MSQRWRYTVAGLSDAQISQRLGWLLTRGSWVRSIALSKEQNPANPETNIKSITRRQLLQTPPASPTSLASPPFTGSTHSLHDPWPHLMSPACWKHRDPFRFPYFYKATSPASERSRFFLYPAPSFGSAASA